MARTSEGSRSINLLFVVMALAFVSFAYMIGARSDESAWNEDEMLAVSTSLTIAYEDGRKAGRDEMAERVASAYGQGQRDALESLQGRPEGLQLVQLCGAWGAAR